MVEGCVCIFVVVRCKCEEECCSCDVLYVVLVCDLEQVFWRFGDLCFGVFLECGIEEVFCFDLVKMESGNVGWVDFFIQ